MVRRPSGTVTFLFTDIEGSSRRWEDDAADATTLFAEHDALLAEVMDRHGGYVFSHMGDGVAVGFARPSDAVAAAVEAQERLASGPFAEGGLKVRIGIHTGEAVERDGDYFGPTVNRAARIMAAGHGGQVLLSAVTAHLVTGIRTVDLGDHVLSGVHGAVAIHQLVINGLSGTLPPLRTEHEIPTTLPNPRTSFIGRDVEVTQVIGLLSDHRMVTVVGPGGAGKTRLAIEAARASLGKFCD